MRVIGIGVILWGIALSANALSFQQAQGIFKILLASNNLHYVTLHYSSSRDDNAYSDMFGVTIKQGMLSELENEDELAMVLGHELGHITLHHHVSNIPNEYAADKVGAGYARVAGYGVCHGAEMYLRWGDPESDDHPAAASRYYRLGCH